MPSFHASAAVILGWGFWSSRLLRWPLLLLNVMMLVSSVPIGGHYIVDVLAGAATACFAIGLVRAQAAWRVSAAEDGSGSLGSHGIAVVIDPKGRP